MDTVEERPYPSERAADVALRDGSTLHVRPVRRDDTDNVREFLAGLSPESMVFRFFGVPNLDWVTSWSTDVDYSSRYALVAETGSPARIVAHAAYVREDSDRAEVAFLVADALQGHGISTILLAHLAVVARENGINRFTADVMPSNHRMIEVFRESGFPVEIRASSDSIAIELPTDVSAEAKARFEERDRLAAVAAVDGVLTPTSVAVVGASRRRGTISGTVLRNIIRSGYKGRLYPVNPLARTVHGLRAFPSVSAIGEPVELAVVVTPAEQVLDVARDCAQAGVRSLVVISSGFAEIGLEGQQRQRQLLEICRGAGIRVVGPNCLGVINTDPEVNLNATFAERPPLPGSIGFMSQSGGLGIAVTEAAARRRLGLSSFVAVGNKADLSGNDMLCYWEQDPNTALAMLYLESFGNPRKFARIAPHFARRKPLLAVKSGRSAAGVRASRQHTGTLLSGSETAVEALFEQAGVIRTDTLHELFTVAQLLTTQPVPLGDRVAIVTNAAGPGIMCADACQAAGVAVPEVDTALEAKLRQLVPAGGSCANPIDLLGSSEGETYAKVLQTLIDADFCDAILTIFVPSLRASAGEVARAVREVVATRPPVTIASVFMTEKPPPAALHLGDVQVPGFEFPEDAAFALARAARHGRWRSRPEPVYRQFDNVEPEHAAVLISRQLAEESDWMPPETVAELFACYGLPAPGASEPPDATKLVVGVTSDSNFGPVIACGAGSRVGRLAQDVSVRLTPLSEGAASDMIRSLKTFPLLDGYRGAPKADVASLEELLLRISAIADTHAEIVDLECDPVYVSESGAVIEAARVRVQSPPPTAPLPSLQATWD
jgi:acetyl coenzyme A synthetase (ADP forming)-like protein